MGRAEYVSLQGDDSEMSQRECTSRRSVDSCVREEPRKRSSMLPFLAAVCLGAAVLAAVFDEPMTIGHKTRVRLLLQSFASSLAIVQEDFRTVLALGTSGTGDLGKSRA